VVQLPTKGEREKKKKGEEPAKGRGGKIARRRSVLPPIRTCDRGEEREKKTKKENMFCMLELTRIISLGKENWGGKRGRGKRRGGGREKGRRLVRAEVNKFPSSYPRRVFKGKGKEGKGGKEISEAD